MIIYLEGPDGSGKSTLADKIVELCKQLNKKYDRNGEPKVSTHPTRPNRVNANEVFNILKDMAESDEIVILDRGPISDNLYRMFDNYEPVAQLPDYIKLFKEFVDKNQMLIIYTRTMKAEEAMRARGDDNPVALNRHKELTKAYDLIMGLINMNLKNHCWRFDYTLPNATEEILKIVENFIVGGKDGNKTR